MVLNRRRVTTVAVAAAVLAALLAYLRDPPWLIDYSSGFAEWRMDPSGIRYRPMGGRGSFFVPADAEAITFPVRARFVSRLDWPIRATVSVDDRAVDRLLLTDGGWRTVTIPLRRGTRRRVRRIDLHADRTRHWNYALDVGAIEVR